ncbi:MAG: HPr family phosphocarrier protein [Rickettsiales bacterium]|nr:HPr family phosphocarrier protein [Rickettsiales bacterium]
MASASATVEITNKKGLHARAAAKFVKVVTGFEADVLVTKMGQDDLPPVSGASILGLMMLGADPGSKLALNAMGAQAEQVVAALKELIEHKFGEGE